METVKVFFETSLFGSHLTVQASTLSLTSSVDILDNCGSLRQILAMRYPVILEPIPVEEKMPGYYYAFIPSLSLTTHGRGMEGALEAARDLLSLWNDEKRANGEAVSTSSEAILASVEVA